MEPILVAEADQMDPTAGGHLQTPLPDVGNASFLEGGLGQGISTGGIGLLKDSEVSVVTENRQNFQVSGTV